MALPVQPRALVNRAVSVDHLALPVSFACEPLALVLAAVLVGENALALSLPTAKAAAVLQPQLAMLAHPVSSESILMIVLKFTLVFITVLEQKGSLA